MLSLNLLLIIFGIILIIVYVAYVIYSKFKPETFIDRTNTHKYRNFYRNKGGWDSGFYKYKLPFNKVTPKNTKYELLERFYGGNKIIQFNEYLEIINNIYSSISEGRSLDTYSFGPMKTSKLCSFHINEEKIKNILETKINEINYKNKIIYDSTCENFLVQEPKLELSKCSKTGAILIHYYFTLYHPKRETSINSIAKILIDEDKKIEIVNVNSAVQFSGDYNGYQKHTSRVSSMFETENTIPFDICLPK